MEQKQRASAVSFLPVKTPPQTRRKWSHQCACVNFVLVESSFQKGNLNSNFQDCKSECEYMRSTPHHITLHHIGSVEIT